jgi:2'-5' RNA ligase
MADADDQSSLSSDDFRFLVTIMTSEVGSPEFKPLRIDIQPLVLQAETYAMFGPNCDQLVIRGCRNDGLDRLFESYRSTFGHVFKYMPYRPHVTIKRSTANKSREISETM